MAENEKWFHNKWRPSIGWLYLVVVFFDFFGASILWPILLFWAGQPITAWEPITHGGGGLFHVSMLGIIGANVAGRSYEKLKGVASDQRIG